MGQRQSPCPQESQYLFCGQPFGVRTMTTVRLSLCIGAIVGALLCLGSASWAQSDTIATPKPKPKPATAAPKRAATAATHNANDYWSINYAAPTRYETGRNVTSRETTVLTGELGRVPVETGRSTVGFENQSRMMTYVPGGADPYARKESSFVGMSLNVKNDSKALALPLLPPPPQ